MLSSLKTSEGGHAGFTSFGLGFFLGAAVVLLFTSFELLVANSGRRASLETPAVVGGVQRMAFEMRFDDIHAIDFAGIGNLTDPGYAKQYLNELPGQEHYALLRYMATQFVDCLPSCYFGDLGTRYASSALASASLGHLVHTYDLPGSTEMKDKVKELGYADMDDYQQRGLRPRSLRIEFHNVDLLRASSDTFKVLLGARFIMLDTAHEPFSIPFERALVWRLAASHYGGIVLLDDIHLNEEMRDWFNELICESRNSYDVYDVAAVGHWTGTGLLDFSRSLVIRARADGPRLMPEVPTTTRCEKTY